MVFDGNIPLSLFCGKLVLKFIMKRIKYFDNLFVKFGDESAQMGKLVTSASPIFAY